MFKTLQIAGGHPFGGGSYLLEKWCEHLVAKGCQVDVVRSDPYCASRLKALSGVNLIEDIAIPREISPRMDALAFVQLVRLMRRERYDLVHTYQATPGLLGRFAARLTRVPVILHHQAGWTVREDSPLLERIVYTPLEYLAALAGTHSICVSAAEAARADLFHTAPRRRLVVIPNGIDATPLLAVDREPARRSLRARFDIPEDALLIGNTSRLFSDKGHDSLIRSLVTLRRLLGDREHVLALAGEGPERPALAALAASLGVGDRVRFLGFEKDIPGLLAALDVFVIPSLREGLSISLLEAMAAAKPIVASAIPQNLEVIEDEVTGLSAPPHDAEAMAHAIARFAHSPELARGCAERARERLLRHYTLERWLDATFALCEEQLQRARRSSAPPAVAAPSE